MNLGVVITDHSYSDLAMGLARAASDRGWQLRCFLTDSGVRLLEDLSFLELCGADNYWVALCELSLERYQVNEKPALEMVPKIIVGGQYQDAELVKNSDRVLVF